MSTLKLSFVASAILAAAAVTGMQTAGEPPPCCQEPAKGPGAPELKQETGAAATAGALAVEADKGKQRASAAEGAKADFTVEGMFVDCCSCRPPCPCEVTEVAMGCRGVGVHWIDSGRYAGEDLGGVKIAHAKTVGEWVNLYIDARDEKQRGAAEKFGRAAFAGFGPIKEVKAARIDISGADGTYTVTVDGGKIMRFQTEPVLGGDGKTPVGYTNIRNAVNPTVYQGRIVAATYSDGDKQVTLEKGRNSHFNPTLKSSGRI